MEVSLEEYSKICNLISSCNDLINGKFIFAYNKIDTILKNLSASKEVYNLLANYLIDFNFEREFSRAQFRSPKEQHKFVLPSEKENILPFVFCVLVNINNKNIDLDGFLAEFFTSENKNHSEEFQKFANEVVLPFRDLIAEHFGIPTDSVPSKMTQPAYNTKEEMVTEKEEVKNEVPEEEIQEQIGTIETGIEQSYAELTEERVNQFLLEIKSNCEQILTELPYERKIKESLKEDIEYIVSTIVQNCETQDLKNAIALITALDYMTEKTKVVKIYTREMKNLLISFYNCD